MSLIIKGMEMPNGCYDCPIIQSSDGCFDFECPFNSYLLWHDAEDVIRYRPNNCPHVEIPTPHGRLIDADRLLAVLKSMASTNESVPTTAVLELIDHQPVVLKAEVSE